MPIRWSVKAMRLATLFVIWILACITAVIAPILREWIAPYGYFPIRIGPFATPPSITWKVILAEILHLCLQLLLLLSFPILIAASGAIAATALIKFGPGAIPNDVRDA